MLKYNLGRKINPKRFFPEMQYETIEFYVEGADSPQQAMDEIDAWIKEWIDRTKKKVAPEEPFKDDVFCGDGPSRNDYLNKKK